jgi:hypothetical protein
MQKACQNPWCQMEFQVYSKDREFYKTMQVPEPTKCPDCRRIQRLAFRNVRVLYHRKCDLTGKPTISAYSPDKPFPVYDNDAWWSDSWSALDYGRDYDFNRPFFQQFRELLEAVPRMARLQEPPIENCDYCNAISHSKNCYLLFAANQNEDCYYGLWVNYSKDCVDNYGLVRCTECYECIDCVDCNRVSYSLQAKNCSDSAFLKNCIGSRDCLFSVNLVNKQYCIFNKQYSKEEYEKILGQTNLHSHETIELLKKKFLDFVQSQPTKNYFGAQNENSTGDHLNNCKNACYCFECTNCEDIKYCNNIANSKDCMDHSYWGENCERIYECQAVGINCINLKFCDFCFNVCYNLEYSSHMSSSNNCFGCVGLYKKEYCIFNKQYSKKEYEPLLAKIKEHMRSTSEYGEFFPPENSQYAFNETLAHEELPLSKEEVLSRGWKWRDPDELIIPKGEKTELPDSINETDPDICDKVLKSTESGRAYKIIPQEFQFHKKLSLPLPRKHPDERHLDRWHRRNPRKLWNRTCNQCQKEIQTSYSEDRPEKVLCEECYLKEVY